jgi:hypothetical protein
MMRAIDRRWLLPGMLYDVSDRVGCAADKTGLSAADYLNDELK